MIMGSAVLAKGKSLAPLLCPKTSRQATSRPICRAEHHTLSKATLSAVSLKSATDSIRRHPSANAALPTLPRLFLREDKLGRVRPITARRNNISFLSSGSNSARRKKSSSELHDIVLRDRVNRREKYRLVNRSRSYTTAKEKKSQYNLRNKHQSRANQIPSDRKHERPKVTVRSDNCYEASPITKDHSDLPDRRVERKLRSCQNVTRSLDLHFRGKRSSVSKTSLKLTSAQKPPVVLAKAKSTMKPVRQYLASPFDTPKIGGKNLRKSKSDLRDLLAAVTLSSPASTAPNMAASSENIASTPAAPMEEIKSKTQFRKVPRNGVVRTRIVKKHCDAFVKAFNPEAHQLLVNPYDDGRLHVMMGRRPTDKITIGADYTTLLLNSSPGEGFIKDTSSSLCPEVMRSTLATFPSGTSKTVAKSKSFKRHSKHNRRMEDGGALNKYVHVTRIRRRVSVARDMNNNAGTDDSEDKDNDQNDDSKKRRLNAGNRSARRKDEDSDDDDSDSDETKRNLKSSRSAENSTIASSSTAPKKFRDRRSTSDRNSSLLLTETSSLSSDITTEDSMSPKLIPKIASSEMAAKKPKQRKKTAKKKKPNSVDKEYKDIKKSTLPPCPLFQGWDFGKELKPHKMTRLPQDWDLVDDLAKMAKNYIWETKNRPLAINNDMPRHSIPAYSSSDDIKTYLAGNGISDFIQHLTTAATLTPRNESIMEALLVQGAEFQQRMRYEQDTDEFLSFVFGKLGGGKPIAFPSVTKSRNVDRGPDDDRKSTFEMYKEVIQRYSAKRSFDIVIGSALTPRPSNRPELTSKRNTLAVGFDSRRASDVIYTKLASF